jgi:hypothetical protein
LDFLENMRGAGSGGGYQRSENERSKVTEGGRTPSLFSTSASFESIPSHTLHSAFSYTPVTSSNSEPISPGLDIDNLSSPSLNINSEQESLVSDNQDSQQTGPGSGKNDQKEGAKNEMDENIQISFEDDDRKEEDKEEDREEKENEDNSSRKHHSRSPSVSSVSTGSFSSMSASYRSVSSGSSYSRSSGGSAASKNLRSTSAGAVSSSHLLISPEPGTDGETNDLLPLASSNLNLDTEHSLNFRQGVQSSMSTGVIDDNHLTAPPRQQIPLVDIVSTASPATTTMYQQTNTIPMPNGIMPAYMQQVPQWNSQYMLSPTSYNRVAGEQQQNFVFASHVQNSVPINIQSFQQSAISSSHPTTHPQQQMSLAEIVSTDNSATTMYQQQTNTIPMSSNIAPVYLQQVPQQNSQPALPPVSMSSYNHVLGGQQQNFAFAANTNLTLNNAITNVQSFQQDGQPSIVAINSSDQLLMSQQQIQQQVSLTNIVSTDNSATTIYRQQIPMTNTIPISNNIAPAYLQQLPQWNSQPVLSPVSVSSVSDDSIGHSGARTNLSSSFISPPSGLVHNNAVVMPSSQIRSSVPSSVEIESPNYPRTLLNSGYSRGNSWDNIPGTVSMNMPGSYPNSLPRSISGNNMSFALSAENPNNLGRIERLAEFPERWGGNRFTRNWERTQNTGDIQMQPMTNEIVNIPAIGSAGSASDHLVNSTQLLSGGSRPIAVMQVDFSDSAESDNNTYNHSEVENGWNQADSDEGVHYSQQQPRYGRSRRQFRPNNSGNRGSNFDIVSDGAGENSNNARASGSRGLNIAAGMFIPRTFGGHRSGYKK